MRTQQTKRVGIVDEVRGFEYILMILYHIYYDLAFVYNIDLPQPVDIIMKYVQLIFGCVFIAIAGIAANYSSNNFKRGAQYFFIGMMMTFVTAIAMPSETIVFGVLHFMGIAAMIYGFVGKYTEAIPCFIGILLFGLLYAFTLNVPQGYIGFDGLFRIDLPSQLYGSSWMFSLGFPNLFFSSSDYFPIIPFIFLYFAGASLGVYFKSGRAPKGLYDTHFHGLTVIGKHGLWIYLLHQPVIILILEVIFKITGQKTLFM